MTIKVSGLIPDPITPFEILKANFLFSFVDEVRPIVMKLLLDVDRHLLEEVGVEVDVEPGSHDGCRLRTVGVGGFIHAQRRHRLVRPYSESHVREF